MEELINEAGRAAENEELDTAVELYGRACAEYSSSHDGEENPDFLVLYARALFKVAVRDAGMFNNENVPEEEEAQAAASKEPNDKFQFVSAEDVGSEEKKDEKEEEKQEEKEDDKDEPEGAAKDEDDFSSAWSLVELARVLYEKKLQSSREQADATDAQVLEQKLADVYTFLGEIALEDDNPSQAVEDFRRSLDLKRSLKSPDGLGDLSASHYMLALALDLQGDAKDRPEALKQMRSAYEVAKQAGVDTESLEALSEKVREFEEADHDHKDSVTNAVTGLAGEDAAQSDKPVDAVDITTLARKKRKLEKE